jgi:RNA polymerase sigma-70 factor (ECF subfamily)
VQTDVDSRRRGPDPNVVARARQAQAGDEQAFTDLFETLHPAVLNYAYQILGDGPSAEDVTQDAFVVAHQRLGMLGPPYDFKSWVFRIAGNLAIDQIRKDRRLVDLEDADVMSEPPTTRRPPEKQARRGEQQRLIRRTLERLPPAYRQALVLREIHELSYEELARALECSYDSARQLVHRARLRFRDVHGLRLTLADGAERCQELGDLVSAFHDGELSGEAEAAARKHIASCPQCRETQSDLRSVAALMVILPRLIPSPHWGAQALQKIQQGGAPGQGAGKVRARVVEQSHPDAGTVQWLYGSGPSSSGIWLVGALFGAAALVGVIGVVRIGMGAWRYTGTATPAPSSVPIASPTATEQTATPTPDVGTPTPTPTPTITVSPTLDSASASANQNSNCRTGPSTVYRNVATLLKGETTALDGRNAESTWWWIPMPGGLSGHCWVWGGSLTLTGPTASLPLIAAPPTDTPIPGDSQPPDASISSAPTGPGRPTDHDKLSLIASAADAGGIEKIEVWLRLSSQQQPVLMRTCTQATTCYFSGGPYPAGMAQAFARAWDTKGNQGESNAISFQIYPYIE